MQDSQERIIGRIVILVLVPLLCGTCGLLCGGVVGLVAYPKSSLIGVSSERRFPLPHHVPKYPGSITLRFAMVHDVIHERFPRHGPDYYRTRNREVELALPKLNPAAKGEEADNYFRLIDDLGVGLEFLGQHQDAVNLMHDKLKRQEALGYADRELYSTYANLGTFLILWQLSEGVGDAPRAKARISESIEWIRKAVKVFPASHFGRESWQVVLEEFLLAVLDDPELLLRFDMIEDRLDEQVQLFGDSCFDEYCWAEGGRPPRAARAVAYLKEPDPKMDTSEFRSCIRKVGAEENASKMAANWNHEKVPFDEPTLGIIGMWQMGAGANPHFALALGEIMLRVGQRYIAWTAFERAYQLRAAYWPDQRIQEQFGKHCRDRQRLVEGKIRDEDWEAVRAKFEKELEFGQKYQKEYQEYEARNLAAGASTDDPHLYDEFEAGHPDIASPVGEEEFTIQRYWERDPFKVWSLAILIAGVFAFIGALVHAAAISKPSSVVR